MNQQNFLNHMTNFLAPSDTLIMLIGEMVFYTFFIGYMAYKLFNIARNKPAYSKDSTLEEHLYIFWIIVLMVVNVGIYNKINDQEFVNKNRAFKEVPIDGKNNINFYKAIIRNPAYKKMSEGDKAIITQAIFDDVTCLNVRFCENYLKNDVRLVHLNGYLQLLLSSLDSKKHNVSADNGNQNSSAVVVQQKSYKEYTRVKYGGQYFDSQQHFFAFNDKSYRIRDGALKEFEKLENEYEKTWK